jgi:SAM-dependent methyltransferase
VTVARTNEETITMAPSAAITGGSNTTGSATVQATLWGPRAEDWADCQEHVCRPLFAAVLAATGVGRGTDYLDIGCGSGLALHLASGLGARPSGLDATPELAAIARRRTPGADVRAGEMESLPFAATAFDVATFFNAVQYATDSARALTEAKRVLRPRGRIAVAVWGRPQECQPAVYLSALGRLLPPPPPGAPGPFALSAEGALGALAARAGLRATAEGAVDCPFAYPDLETALRALLSAGPAVRAVNAVGEERVRAAVTEALAAFATPEGGIFMGCRFRYAVCEA